MKSFKLFLMTVPLLLTLMISGCMMHHDQVAGSGQRQKEKRDIGTFTSISTEGAYEIEVTSQKELSLEIEADDNILPLITTDVSGGVLRIKSKRSYSVNKPITIRISTPNLEGISASGAGSLEVTDLQNDRFEIDSNGAPAIKVSGQTKSLDVNSNGAGKIDALRLRADTAQVEANGVASVDVYVTNELNVTVSGPSTVSYRGDPKVNKTVNGPGSVQKRESEGS